MSAFIAALAALRAHQAWIDVIGNNLANQNTPGFKGSRVLFSDLLSITRQPATPPTGNLGGTNPLQFGLGVQLASVDRRLDQGALNVTGRAFDLMLVGRGLFAVTDGTRTLYSRVGAFGLDAGGNMVDLRTGYRVLDAAGSTFQIDTSAVFPPAATTEVGFSGNLPAEVTGPLAEVLSSSSPFNDGMAAQMTGAAVENFAIPAGQTWTMELLINGGAPQSVAIQGTGVDLTAQEVVDAINTQTEDVVAAVGAGGTIELTSERSGLVSTIRVNAGTSGQDLKGLLGLGDFVQGTENTAATGTDLNDLTINLTDYQVGDEINITGTDVDGSPVVAAFTYGVDGTTLGELVAFLNTQFTQSTVVLDATGQIAVTAGQTGEANLTLSITDVPASPAKTDWAASFFAVTANGTGPDTVTTSAEVFDGAGTAHVVTFDYVRQDDGSWTIEYGLGPTPLCPPDSELEALFNSVGNAVPVDDESLFSAFASSSATMATFFDLVAVIAKWMEVEGVSDSQSTLYVTSMMHALATLTTRVDAENLQLMSLACLTPGGLNEQVLRGCQSENWTDTVVDQLDKVRMRLA